MCSRTCKPIAHLAEHLDPKTSKTPRYRIVYILDFEPYTRKRRSCHCVVALRRMQALTRCKRRRWDIYILSLCYAWLEMPFEVPGWMIRFCTKARFDTLFREKRKTTKKGEQKVLTAAYCFSLLVVYLRDTARKTAFDAAIATKNVMLYVKWGAIDAQQSSVTLTVTHR